MNRVSFVCTVHEEAGQANVAALRAILERIQPEVIFLEVPPEALAVYYETFAKANLESMAVRQYREVHPVKLVPVDLPTPPPEFFLHHDELCRRVRRLSAQYRQLMQLDEDGMRESGFAYLNSERCSEIWSCIYKDILSSIDWMKASELGSFFDSWIETNNRRDVAMMENIDRYCHQKTFNRGVFLVGAAHRRAIIQKAREQASPIVEWDFDGWMSAATRGSPEEGADL